ncbi:hypothetical protein [Rouxiella sp. Mn2063]|uniref:hypothetical protein n=1 Tax=Rouxiella sp. Mn2063 TaxID=3395262 RepID=UPI003BC3C410
MKEITNEQLLEISGAGYYHDELSSIGNQLTETISNIANGNYGKILGDTLGVIGSGADVAVHSVSGTANFVVNTASKIISSIIPFKNA